MAIRYPMHHNPGDPPLRDQVVSERPLAEHRAYDAVELTIAGPDGTRRTKPAVRHRGAVAIIPFLERAGQSRAIVVIENERVIPGRRLIEIPAGGIDGDESPAESAAREVREETGYTAEALTEIGSFYTSPGMSDEVMHVFAATGLTHVGQDLEPWESIRVLDMTPDQILESVDDGTIRDGKTIAALLLAQRRGYLEES